MTFTGLDSLYFFVVQQTKKTPLEGPGDEFMNAPFLLKWCRGRKLDDQRASALCLAAGMSLQVERQVIRSGKGAIARLALEGAGTCVFPEVSGQLVGAGETPGAPLPAAGVGLFSRVGALVGLQVRALGVDLVAAWMRALVHPLRRFLRPPPLRRSLLLSRLSGRLLWGGRGLGRPGLCAEAGAGGERVGGDDGGGGV